MINLFLNSHESFTGKDFQVEESEEWGGRAIKDMSVSPSFRAQNHHCKLILAH